MGQAMRMMSYDRAANERGAVSALHMAGRPLSWFRLDDGVMGGQSETNHVTQDGVLRFAGTINTNGGGFASVRSKVPEGVFAASTEAVRIQFRGDGKTYKCLLSSGGSSGSPFSRSPSWQADVPTKKDVKEGEWESLTVPFASFVPSFGGSASLHPDEDRKNFRAAEVSELGFMLSLKLASGQPNPKETFGEGVFPFELHVKSIEPVPQQ